MVSSFIPFFLTPENKVAEAEELMQRYRISGVPIVETLENRKLVGIITNRDMRFISNYDTPISEHMTSEKLVTAPVGTDLETAESILHEHRIEKLPLVDEEGRLSGLITIKDIEKVIEFPNAAKDEFGRLLVAGAVGVTSDTFERAEALLKQAQMLLSLILHMVIQQVFFVKLLKFVPTSQIVL